MRKASELWQDSPRLRLTHINGALLHSATIKGDLSLQTDGGQARKKVPYNDFFKKIVFAAQITSWASTIAPLSDF